MKLLKGMIIGVLVILGLVYYTYTNLKYNSVYYAQHMPHKEGTDPDLVMLIENMGWIYKPEIDGIRFDDDGRNLIENSTFLGDKTTSFDELAGGYGFTDQNGITYKFDKHFSLEWAVNKDYDTLNLTNLEEERIKLDIRNTVQPILNAQTKPFINLQWLFNLIYQDRFQ